MVAVLVVEDDSTLGHAIVRNLIARKYDAVSVGSVAEALAALERTSPELVLLDIDLPDGSGWDVLRAVRARDGAPAAVIVLSALRPNPRLIEEFGCFGQLEKPFPMESLLRLITQSLNHAKGEAPKDEEGT